MRYLPLTPDDRARMLAVIGAPWAPYRSVAAWYLWRAVDQYKLAMTKPPITPSLMVAGITG